MGGPSAVCEAGGQTEGPEAACRLAVWGWHLVEAASAAVAGFAGQANMAEVGWALQQVLAAMPKVAAAAAWVFAAV